MKYSTALALIAGILAAFCIQCSVAKANEQCMTPDRANGLCRNLVECPQLLQMLRNTNRSPQETQYLQQSMCDQVGSMVYVCCKLESAVSARSSSNLLPTTRDCGKSFDNRIYGGNVTRIDEYPWLALIEYTKPGNIKNFFCGGSLINKRYILTAAHCVTGRALQTNVPTGVRLGEWDRSTTRDCERLANNQLDCADPHIDVGIEDLIPHPQYNENSANRLYDIALIRLNRDIEYTNFVSPVCLPMAQEMRTKTFNAMTMDVSGFGATETGTSSNLKLKATIEAWTDAECRQKYAMRRINLENSQMCAGGVAGIDSCTGDSGGPLVVRQRLDNRDVYVQAGIVSFGPRQCATAGWPGVYTRVGAYADWILQNMKP
ncbi:serine protease easter-like [Musca vetustissima]|uniref:serine protease easter-like n=1 Tax=Musca vetustissima TaxID=27455 RepID=UPI002AB6CB42|nr:serine protease easter-like [Musca vetustissima]